MSLGCFSGCHRLCRRQGTLRHDTLAPDPFCIGAGVGSGHLVDSRGSARDLSRCLEPVRVLECFVLGVFQLIDNTRAGRRVSTRGPELLRGTQA